MGRGPLLVTASASTSFLPSAWLSRSTLPPARTRGRHIRVQLTSGPVTQASAGQQMLSQLQPHGPVDPPRKGRMAEATGAPTGSRLGEPRPPASRPRERGRVQRPLPHPALPRLTRCTLAVATATPLGAPVKVSQGHGVPQPRDWGHWAPCPGLRAPPSRKDGAWLPLWGPGPVLDHGRHPDRGIGSSPAGDPLLGDHSSVLLCQGLQRTLARCDVSVGLASRHGRHPRCLPCSSPHLWSLRPPWALSSPSPAQFPGSNAPGLK